MMGSQKCNTSGWMEVLNEALCFNPSDMPHQWHHLFLLAFLVHVWMNKNKYAAVTKNLYFVCNLDNYMTKDNWLTNTLNHMDGIWHAWYTFPDSWSPKGEKECRARQIQIYGSRWLTSSAADAVVRTFMTSSRKQVLALAHKYWCLHILTKAKLLPRAAQTLPRAQHVVFHISCCIMDFRD